MNGMRMNEDVVVLDGYVNANCYHALVSPIKLNAVLLEEGFSFPSVFQCIQMQQDKVDEFIVSSVKAATISCGP